MIIRNGSVKEIYTREACHITELLNSVDLPGLSVAVARVEPGVTTELHWLEVDEVYYILEGLGEMQIDTVVAENVGKGDLIYIPKGSSQQITNRDQRDLLFLCICTPRFRDELYHQKK